MHERLAARRGHRVARLVSPAVSELTVGIDIGTSSVKAVAADADGNIVARSRIPHDFFVPSPLRFEHDASGRVARRPAARARRARRRRRARGVGRGDGAVAHVGRRRRRPVRARTALRRRARPRRPRRRDRPRAGELAQFLRWQSHEHPDARGYWMAQAVANHALSGQPVISSTVAATAAPLFDWKQWDEEKLAECGARVDQMPMIGPSGHALAEVTGRPGCVLEGGTIDAFGEQLVAGCDDVGDVLVICGTTLIVWAVMPESVEVDRPLLDPAHRARQVPRRAARATRAACSSTGSTAMCGGGRRIGRRHRRVGRRSGPGADLGAVPARRAGARSRTRRGARNSSTSTSPTTPRRSGGPRSRRPASSPGA